MYMTRYKDRYRPESTRLQGWDYASAGYYFVTICTRDRLCTLGDVVAGSMRLSPVGESARTLWQGIPDHAQGVELDEFVVMPNHLHGIIVIRDVRRDVACNVSTTPIPTPTTIGVVPTDNAFTDNASTLTMARISPKTGSLGAIIRSYKSAVTNWCRKNDHDFAWQSRFYDEIIRDENMLDRVREYIRNNSLQWELDQNNPANNVVTTL